uniref:Uncharacterized protein n=1 Tax=Megaviridae environmental sample TaxID=1737588 RepID=A0A5J6VJT2_9VIRU|nr:MAG: hypothetical protein [Megaviridae environmental sample]
MITELLRNIYDYTSEQSKSNIASVIPEIQAYHNKRSNAAKIIKKWWKRYSLYYLVIDLDYELFTTKKTLLRYYRALYPIKYLLLFPEFMVDKLENVNRFGLRDSLTILPPINTRKPSQVMDFLARSEITHQDIVYAGW